MTRNENVEVFIRTCFDEFCLAFTEYFGYTDSKGKKREVPLLTNGALNEDAVRFASRILGISVEDITACNYAAMFKLRDKYPYFAHYKALDKSYEQNICGPYYAEYKIKESIFGRKQPVPFRYNLVSVRDRLIEQLRELDRHLPGSYHEGAKIQDLKISYQKICHYGEIKAFIEEYLQMINRAGELFFKALETDLGEEEIHEYNLLVTVLGIRDFVCAQLGELYYDNLVKCREIYRQENLPNFYDYITLSPARSFAPWRCAEFSEDRELVQRYINYHPYFKFVMREFAMKALYFKCDFAWSDAKHEQLYDDKWLTKEDYANITGEPAPEKNWVLERTEVYVPKTAEELEDNAEYARRLLVLGGSEKQGGIIYPTDRNKPDNEVKRITARMPLIVSSNFAEWYKQTYGKDPVVDDSSGGGGNG